MPDIRLAIVAGSDQGAAAAALSSVLRHAGWLDLDVVVVDTGDGRVAAHIDEHFLDVRTMRCPGRSFGDACNRALEGSAARYALFLSPALEVCEGGLAALVAGLDRRPELGVLGVSQVDAAGAPLPSIRRFPSTRHILAEALGLDRLPAARRLFGEHELGPRGYARETECDWTGGFLLARRAAFEEVGRFDPRFLRFAAEADLCLRLGRGGWGVVHTPTLTVRRRPLGRLELAQLEAQAAYARIQFARKHFPAATADYRWAMTLRYGLRAAVHSVSRRGREGAGQAARAALATVLSGRVPCQEPSPL